MKKKQKTYTWIIIIAIAIAGMMIYKGDGEEQKKMDDFATCLTEKGAVMYGAFWCSHCMNTKKSFGKSFKNINYIECDPRGENEQSETCIDKEITGYPTWEFSDGMRLHGEIKFEVLQEKTGCELAE